jgi:hypothetical protein
MELSKNISIVQTIFIYEIFVKKSIMIYYNIYNKLKGISHDYIVNYKTIK